MQKSFSKRVVAVVLAVMMVVTMIPVMAISASAADTISTEADLIAAAAAGGEYSLGADIDLTEAFTDYKDIARAGVLVKNDFVLDGAGYTITASNPDITRMFVENNENVKLTMSDVTLDGTSKTQWAITAYTGNGGKNYGNEINLTNCTVKNFVGLQYVGAINAFGSGKATLTNCTFTGNTSADPESAASGADVWAGAATTLTINGGTYAEVYANADSGGNAKVDVLGEAEIGKLSLGASDTHTATATIADTATVSNINVGGKTTEVQVVMANGKVNIKATSYNGAKITIGGVAVDENNMISLTPAEAANYSTPYDVVVDGTKVGTFTMNNYIDKLTNQKAKDALNAFEVYAKACANTFRNAGYDMTEQETYNLAGIDTTPEKYDNIFCSVAIDCSAQTKLVFYADGITAGTPILDKNGEEIGKTVDCGSAYHTAAAVAVNDFSTPVEISVGGHTIKYKVKQAAALIGSDNNYKSLAYAIANYADKLADYYDTAATA